MKWVLISKDFETEYEARVYWFCSSLPNICEKIQVNDKWVVARPFVVRQDEELEKMFANVLNPNLELSKFEGCSLDDTDENGQPMYYQSHIWEDGNE